MRYYLDTEFIDNGSTIDLISIGIVCEDGREYYAQSEEYNPHHLTQWLHDNVMPHLTLCPHGYEHVTKCGDSPSKGCPWRSRKEIRDEIIAFLGTESFDLYGWCSAYDFVAFCQLFGTMMDLPAFCPHYVNDLQQELDAHGISDEELPQQEQGLHNALADARHIKHLWGVVCGHYADKGPILPPYIS